MSKRTAGLNQLGPPPRAVPDRKVLHDPVAPLAVMKSKWKRLTRVEKEQIYAYMRERDRLIPDMVRKSIKQKGVSKLLTLDQHRRRKRKVPVSLAKVNI